MKEASLSGDPAAAPVIDRELVSNLLSGQFPQWAGLAPIPVPSAGTDNALFRLGETLVVRLPKIGWAAGQPGKEHHWLPRLASALPLAIPDPLALGEPACGYPCPWTVCRWLPGETLSPHNLADAPQTARTLAAFVIALQRADAAGGPASGRQNHNRGVALACLDGRVRAALNALEGRIDVARAARVWDLALRAPPWTGEPVWLHGDLHGQNLLAVDGRLSAVIDFGLLGVGDPATDLMAAWTVFDARARAVFRGALPPDRDRWARARGWALYSSVVALPFYWDTNPALVAGCLRTLGEVLADRADADPL